jgi:manganese efflux pump family protein
MGTITLFLIALGLSMDAFAVSISDGICYRDSGPKTAFSIALTFGVFQAGMPLLGYAAGKAVSHTMSSIDHWIALALLCAIGISMIWGAVKKMRNPEEETGKTKLTIGVLLVQGIATSMDAFAVGISFAIMETNIFIAVTMIGIVTFICSIIGVMIGKRFGGVLKEKAEILGGCILLAIGLKIFFEHMLSS